MNKRSMLACVTALMLPMALGACDKAAETPAPTSEKAAAAAGDKTLATGLGNDARFAAAVKAAGLDAALAGPTPYTVLVPSDAAFDKLPAGAVDDLLKPESRKALTAVLTGHILPGTMLSTDIGKAIDAGGGKVEIATLGGGKVTATRAGTAILITDATGTRATVSSADDQRSNGVIHRIDAVLMPAT